LRFPHMLPYRVRSRSACQSYMSGWTIARRKMKQAEVFWVTMTEIQLPRPISRILFRGCSEQTEAELLSKMRIQEGAMLSEELLQRARQAAKAYNHRLAVLVRQSIRHEEFFKSPAEIRKTFTPPVTDNGVNVIVFDPATPPQRIRVEGSEQRPC
jgi:hypothetical protein